MLDQLFVRSKIFLSYRGTSKKQHAWGFFNLKDRKSCFTSRNNIVSGLYAVYIAYDILYYIYIRSLSSECTK